MTLQAIKKRLLDLAIRGQLVPQIPSEGTADNLLQQIADEHRATFAPQQGKKYKPLTFSNIPDSEIPFEIPTNWKWVRLGEITKTFSTGPFGTMLHKDDYCESGIPVVNPTNIKNNLISTKKIERVSIETAERLQSYKLSTNDLVLARRGDLSKIAIVTKKENGWICGTGSFILKLNTIDNAFFVMLYRSSFMQNYLMSQSSGSTMANLNQKSLFSLLIPLPPLSEQQRIVSKLDLMFKEISVIEESQKSLDGLSTAIWRRSLAEAIAGRLTTQLESDGTADILLDQIKAAHREAFDAEQAKAKAAAEKSGKKFVPKKYTPLTFSQIPQSEIPFNIPENWKWVRLGEICSIQSGLSYKKEDLAVVSEQMVRVLRGGNIDFGKWMEKDDDVFIDSSFVKSNLYLKKGYLITPGVTSLPHIGKTALIENDLANVVVGGFVLFMIPTLINTIFNKYLMYVCSSKFYIDCCQQITNASGSAFYNLSRVKMTNLLIPLPPLSEQERIVAKLDRLRGALGRE